MKNKFQLVTFKQPNEIKFAARCLPLGLTAYGDTENEAWEKLEIMFHSYLLVHRKYKTYEEVEK
jgi:hypothetical protein